MSDLKYSEVDMNKSEGIVCRGVAGATLPANNSRSEVQQAVRELVLALVQANGVEVEDLAAGFVTAGADVNTADAVQAIRHIAPRFDYFPLTGATDASGPPRLVRVLLLWNTAPAPREIKHIYLRGTESRRWAGVAEVAG